MHLLTKRDQIPPTPSSSLPPPPGIAGVLAKFVFASSERPVPEVAILAALGIIAGICGKAFKVGNYGLNIRAVFIAENCVAEDALNCGLRSFVSAVANSYPAITQFVEFSELSNGDVLTKSLASRHSVLNVVGEISTNLAGMTTSKNNRMVSLKEAMEHPDKTTCSGYSMIGTTTPGRLGKTLTASVLGSVFIHGFMMLEYPGGRPPANEHREHLVPDDLHEHVVNLCQVAINNRDYERHTSVKVDGPASLLLQKFNSFCDAVINGSDDDVLRLVWDRAHEKTLRVAALLAVADDCLLPVINLQHAEWTREFVLRGIDVLNRHTDAAQTRGKKRAVRS